MHYHCIHGAWHGAWVWDPLIDRLSDAGHTVTAPDLPGPGAPPHHRDESINLESHIRAAVPENAGWLVGHSYGGMIAKALIDRYPDKVMGIILIEALWPERSGQSVIDLLPQAAAETIMQRTEESGNGWTMPPPPAAQFAIADKQLETQVERRLVHQPLATFEQALEWHDNTTPQCFLIASDRNPQPYEATADRLKLNGCRVKHISGGHNLMLTNPDAVFDAMAQIASHRS
jgi:pimeloyl-ACP methyl ester carboxylesterase